MVAFIEKRKPRFEGTLMTQSVSDASRTGAILAATAHAACAAFLLCLLAGIAAAADSPSQAVRNFRAGFFDGCTKSQLAASASEKYADAFCACALSALDTEMTASERDELVKTGAANPSALADHPPYQRVLRKQQECRAVGQYDTDEPPAPGRDLGLSPPRVFEEFSIRLPDGFIVLPRQELDGLRAYLFVRHHADLETSTVIQVSVLPFPGDIAGQSEQALDEAAEKYLQQMLAGIRKQRENWAQKPTFATTIAAQRFRVAEWSGSVKGEPLEGLMYVTIAPGRIILVSSQDFARYSGNTMPLARSSIATITLR